MGYTQSERLTLPGNGRFGLLAGTRGTQYPTYSIWLNIYDDNLDEPDETVVVRGWTRELQNGTGSFTYTITDNDPTIVSLAKATAGNVLGEGGSLVFTVALGRALVAGETIDVPLSMTGQATTGDWSLAKSSGGSLNTGVTLRDTGTSTPKVRFSGAGAQTATLELTATQDNSQENTETLNVALGSDSDFDSSSLGTNVGGGADPHSTNNDFDITLRDQVHTVSISIAATQASEGNSGYTDHLVTVSVSPPYSSNFYVDTCISGTATYFEPGDTNAPTAYDPVHDYSVLFHPPTNLQYHSYNNDARCTFGGFQVSSSGQAQKVLRVYGDRDVEVDETVIITLSRRSNTPSAVVIASGSGASVTHRIQNDDTAKDLIITETEPLESSVRSTAVAEGGNDDYLVRLSDQPTHNVRVIMSEGRGLLSISPQTLTFTSANYNTNQTVTVTAPEDNTDNPSRSVSIGHSSFSSDSSFHDLTGSVSVFVTDNDPTHVTLTIPDNAATEEDTAKYALIRLTLNRNLVAGESLVVPVSFSGGALGTLFTIACYSPPSGISCQNTGGATHVGFLGPTGNRMVRLTFLALQDANSSGETVTVSIPTSSTGSAPILSATNLEGGATGSRTGNGRIMIEDNDLPSVSVTESSGSTRVEEGGASDSYDIVLGTQPTQDVMVTATAGAGVQVAKSGGSAGSTATLTFTSATWNTAQTITVTGTDNNVDDPRGRTQDITHSATSTDAGYNNISIDAVTVGIIDNDPTSVTLGGGGTVAEGGSNTADVTVTLGRNLVVNESVTVPLSITGTNIASGDYRIELKPGSSLNTGVTLNRSSPHSASRPAVVFTGHGTNTVQTATLRVRAQDDDVDEGASEALTVGFGTGNRAVMSNLDRASGSGTGGTTTTGSAMVTITDNDSAGIAIEESLGSTLVREGTVKDDGLDLTPYTDIYTVRVLTQPVDFVVIRVSTGDPRVNLIVPGGTPHNRFRRLGGTNLVFRPWNWRTPQRVTVAAMDDNVDQPGNQTVTIRHLVPSSDTQTDANYRNISFPSVTVTVVDNDSAGVTITESGVGTTVNEEMGARNTDTYTVTLDSAPSASVEIQVESSDGEAATVSPPTLTFTTANWREPQSVTVTGVDDEVDQSDDRRATISHRVTSNDARYAGIEVSAVTVTVVGDSAPPAATPAVEFVAAAYSEGEAAGGRTVNVGLRATPAFPASTPVSYRVSGTAAAGEDFTITNSGTIFMTGGAGIIPITILDDQMADDGETIVLTLIAANDYTVGAQGSATITITEQVVSIMGGNGISEGEEAIFTLTATPPPAPGAAISINVTIIDSGDFASSGQTGLRTVTIGDSGTASFRVSTEDDTTKEADGSIVATVHGGSGYRPQGSSGSASVTVADDEVVRLSTPRLRVAAGDSASYQVALDAARPTGGGSATIAITAPQGTGLTITPDRLTFTPTTWLYPQDVTVTVAKDSDFRGAPITLTHTVSGSHQGVTTMELVVAPPPVEPGQEDQQESEQQKAWHLRFGRTVSHQVVEAVEDRWSAPPATGGLQLTVAGESITSAPPLVEHEGLLSKALGFETVTPPAVVEGSAFGFAPSQEGAAPRLAFWGQGAFSSFSGEEDDFSLDGDVTTLLLGTDWTGHRWQAGAALSQSWGSGSYDGDDGADGEISSTVTGLFPYGRYVLTPRLGLWAVAGYGWGQLSLKPDGGDEAKPNTTLGMAAIGLDGVLLDGGSEGVTLTTTADVLTLKTTSEEVDELESSEGNLSRFRLGVEAARPFPLSHGTSLLPSMNVGIRHDSGDAESGYGLDLGAGLLWQDPERGISGELKGHTLVAHGEEEFHEQGLALSFSWEPNPSNRGPSLSLSHTMGATAAGGMDALLNPTTMEELDVSPSSGQRFAAEMAYGFPAHHPHITLTPAVALALSPTTRNYSLLWSLTPYAEQLQADPWELSLAGERQEQNAPASPVDHSLKLRFSLLF